MLFFDEFDFTEIESDDTMTQYEKDMVRRLIKAVEDLKRTRFRQTRIEMQNVLQILHGEIKETVALYDRNGDVKKARK